MKSRFLHHIMEVTVLDKKRTIVGDGFKFYQDKGKGKIR